MGRSIKVTPVRRPNLNTLWCRKLRTSVTPLLVFITINIKLFVLWSDCFLFIVHSNFITTNPKQSVLTALPMEQTNSVRLFTSEWREKGNTCIPIEIEKVNDVYLTVLENDRNL